jgi:hypothetical protein
MTERFSHLFHASYCAKRGRPVGSCRLTISRTSLRSLFHLCESASATSAPSKARTYSLINGQGSPTVPVWSTNRPGCWGLPCG